MIEMSKVSLPWCKWCKFQLIGNIEKGELQEMITALLEIQGTFRRSLYAQCTKTYYTFFLGMSDEVVALKVSQMFASLDVDGNGLISEEEFVLKCQEGKIAVRYQNSVN